MIKENKLHHLSCFCNCSALSANILLEGLADWVVQMCNICAYLASGEYLSDVSFQKFYWVSSFSLENFSPTKGRMLYPTPFLVRTFSGSDPVDQRRQANRIRVQFALKSGSPKLLVTIALSTLLWALLINLWCRGNTDPNLLLQYDIFWPAKT